MCCREQCPPKPNSRFEDVPDIVRRRMARIRKVDTGPELAVRRLTHWLGYRFRLHRGDLPGTPDLVFPSKRKVIFVHGCFWHQHGCRLGGRPPRTRTSYWLPKLARNVARDQAGRAALTELGWASLVIWECETADPAVLAEQLRTFLGK